MRKLVISAVTGLGVLAGLSAGAWARYEAATAGRAAELSAAFEPAGKRAAERRTVAAALVAGEVTEDVAVARFQALLAADPLGPPVELRTKHPGASDQELAARQLALFVRATRADGAADVAGRLEAVADGRGSDRLAAEARP
jgi:hypothetical protein